MNARNFNHKILAEVAAFPAYKIVRRETRDTFFGARIGGERFTVLDAGDQLGLDSGRGYFRSYSISSVLSYAMESAEDPIKAIQQSLARGETMHWINQNATMITAERRAQTQMIEVTLGMLVFFEGLFFTIEADHNDNLKLVPAVLS